MEDSILRVELFQPFSQYRNPFTFYYAQSFPLPPLSTIYGLIGYLTGRYYDENIPDEYKIAIMGRYESSFFHYTNMIKGYKLNLLSDGTPSATYKEKSKEFKDIPLYFRPKTAQRTPVHQTELFNVHLNLFFKSSKTNIDSLLYGFKSKVFTVGRGSDLAVVRSIDQTPSIEKSKFMTMHYGTYAQKEFFEEKETQIRKNEDIPVFYLSKTQKFFNNEKPVKSIHEIKPKLTRRQVEFEKTYFLPFDRKFKFEKDWECWENKDGINMPLFWW